MTSNMLNAQIYIDSYYQQPLNIGGEFRMQAAPEFKLTCLKITQ